MAMVDGLRHLVLRRGYDRKVFPMVEPKTTPKVKQFEHTVYDFRCPNCQEYHESGSDMTGEVIECICGTKFEVEK